MPAKLVDLVIIDPILGDDTGPLWDVGETAWTGVDASDTLRTLMVQKRKFAGVFVQGGDVQQHGASEYLH